MTAAAANGTETPREWIPRFLKHHRQAVPLRDWPPLEGMDRDQGAVYWSHWTNAIAELEITKAEAAAASEAVARHAKATVATQLGDFLDAVKAVRARETADRPASLALALALARSRWAALPEADREAIAAAVAPAAAVADPATAERLRLAEMERREAIADADPDAGRKVAAMLRSLIRRAAPAAPPPPWWPEVRDLTRRRDRMGRPRPDAGPTAEQAAFFGALNREEWAAWRALPATERRTIALGPTPADRRRLAPAPAVAV